MKYPDGEAFTSRFPVCGTQAHQLHKLPQHLKKKKVIVLSANHKASQKEQLPMSSNAWPI